MIRNALVLVGALVAAAGLAPTAAAAPTPGCALPGGVLTAQTLPEGRSAVACDAVGRYVDLGDAVLAVPAPGHGVQLFARYPTYAESYSISTDSAGRIDYEHHGRGVDSRRDGFASETTQAEQSGAAAAAALNANGCDRSTYGLMQGGLKWYGTWRFWIGDGTQPGAGTQTDTANAARRAATNVAGSRNLCGYADQVSATYSYGGFTTLESDFVIQNGASGCLHVPDSKSTIDAGNLDGNGDAAIAMACVWYITRSGPDQITQADVRLNTTNHDFTYNPGSASCRTKYDVESVMTHEFGHAFGLDDLYGVNDRYLTMYGYSPPCSTAQRTLGKGDVLGLRYLY